MLPKHLMWDFWFGGAAIALIGFSTLYVGGRFLSVTRGYASLCSILTGKSYFKNPDLGGKFGDRSMFAIGIVLGGFLAAAYHGGWSLNLSQMLSLGEFDHIFNIALTKNSSTSVIINHIIIKAPILIMGGMLWGYGSRMAKGCTSGNSISGIAQGSLSSVVATVCFLVGGVIITSALVFIKRLT